MGLVLERKIGQSVLVGTHLEVTLEHVSGERITLEVASVGGGRAIRRVLDGPGASCEVGPVRIEAHRRGTRSSRWARLSFDAPRHIAITRSELAAAPVAA